jgi:hypothetical protein
MRRPSQTGPGDPRRNSKTVLRPWINRQWRDVLYHCTRGIAVQYNGQVNRFLPRNTRIIPLAATTHHPYLRAGLPSIYTRRSTFRQLMTACYVRREIALPIDLLLLHFCRCSMRGRREFCPRPGRVCGLPCPPRKAPIRLSPYAVSYDWTAKTVALP